MKYSSLILALAISQYGLAEASDDDANTYESEPVIMEESMIDDDSDDRIACIEAAIADEVEEGSQFDQFVDSCVQEKVAQKQKTRLNNS